MNDPEASFPPPPASPYTLRAEVLLVLGISVAVMLCLGWQRWIDPDEPRIRTHLFDSIGGLLAAIGNVVWISMDLRRRRREVGMWALASFFCGPAVLAVYIILEYRERAFFLLPILVAVYGVTMFLPEIAVHLLRQAWH